MLTGHKQIVAAVLAALYSATAFSQTPAGYPTPGYYFIDTESTTTRGSGLTKGETTERIEGATGKRTVTSKSAVDPDHPVTQTYAGTEPQAWCVAPRVTGASSGAPASACRNKSYTADAGGSSESADCRNLQLENNWRRIDDRNWERSTRVTPQASAESDSPQAAIAMAEASMTSEQRAQAEAAVASLPSSAQINAAMAPVIAALETTIRSGSPEEAALAREQLQALRTPSGDIKTSVDLVSQLHERWTRVAETCPTRH